VGRATADKVIGQKINEVTDRCDVLCQFNIVTYNNGLVSGFYILQCLSFLFQPR